MASDPRVTWNFECPSCGAKYLKTRIEDQAEDRVRANCEHCLASFEPREGTYLLQYELIEHPLPTGPNKHPTSAGTPISKTLKFSKKRLALAFAIAGISDAIGAFATPLPPIVWVVDLGTALLLFMVLGRQWLLLPGLALEAIPGLGVLPFWLLVVGAIAVLGTPRPNFERH